MGKGSPLSALAGAATTGDSRPEVDYTLGVPSVLSSREAAQSGATQGQGLAR
jgi:hypothetical protein